ARRLAVRRVVEGRLHVAADAEEGQEERDGDQAERRQRGADGALARGDGGGGRGGGHGRAPCGGRRGQVGPSPYYDTGRRVPQRPPPRGAQEAAHLPLQRGPRDAYPVPACGAHRSCPSSSSSWSTSSA